MTNTPNPRFEFGARRLGDGQTAFHLWAPAQESVWVAIEDGPLVPMDRDSGGWFTATAQVATGTQYRFRLSDGTLVPDPASRQQADDVHGPSVVVAEDYAWRHPEWTGRPWQDAIIYELHAGLFGGFAGIRRALPRLQALGITAIELMPIADFPGQRNWGYDGVLPYAPDRSYGTPDELKQLIDTAHELGMMVFLDVVYNHFGPAGNYLHSYAPQFFRDDVKTPWGPAIDFRRQEVRDYFIGNVLMWLRDYRFDGLRFDAVHAIHEQDWVTEMAAVVRGSVGHERHIHLVLEHHNAAPHLRAQVDAQWNDDGHNVLHVLLTDETGGYYADYAERPAEQLARCLAEGWVFQGQWSGYLKEQRGEPSADLPPYAHVLFLQNHDQIGNRALGERLTSLADPCALEAAVALQMLCPQIPLIFMGEESGSEAPFLYFTDHEPDLAEAVLEGRRAEFAGFAEFADPANRERIPDPNADTTYEASAVQPEGPSNKDRQALYKHLIALRQSEIVPRLLGAKSAGAQAIGPKAVEAAWTMGDGCKLTIAVNLGGDDIPHRPPVGRQLFPAASWNGSLSGPGTFAWLEAAA
ncbi:MAG: malto-oligosyltrehalose trehalohydrolase [Rhodopila sp.]